jgi:hypothetical protein
MGIMSLTPLSTRFPKIVLDFREGINYLRNIGGNSPEGEEKMTNCRTFNLDFLSFVAYRNYLSANHFSYSTVRVNADIFAVTVTDSDADCPSAFDHFRAEVVA